MEFFDESDAIETNPEGVTSDESQPEVDQPETESTQATETEVDGEFNLESQLDQLEVDSTGPEASQVLSFLNTLGILQNNLPVEVKDEDHLKELLSKGANYTYETQQRNEQLAAKEQEIGTKSQEFETKQQEFEQYKESVNNELVASQLFYQVLQDLEHQDPDVYNDLMSSFRQRLNASQSHINNPQISQFEKKINELETKVSKYESGQVDTEVQKIDQEWKDGLQGIQKEWGVKLNHLKIVPKYQDVHAVWLKNEGKLSPKQAFLAVHGDLINKALKANGKTATTVRRSESVTGGDAATEAARTETSGSMMDYLEKEAEKLGWSA